MNALFGLCLILLASSTTTLSAQCSPDTDAPVISNMPANITGTADAGLCNTNITWTLPSATDDCELSSFAADAAPGELFAVGITVVTYTAMDEAGNMAAASFTVTITDDEDPVIAGMPSDITLSNDADDCTAVHTWTAPTATDNCGIASITSDYNSGHPFPVGTTTVTYTVTDVNGRAVTASFDVTVTDDQDPSISGTPSGINQTADSGDCEAVVTWTAPTADDNCSATLSSTHNPGDSFNVGTTTVTYTATDAAGNSVQTSFDVMVTDDEAPSIAQMAGISQTNDLNACGAVVTWADPAVTDNCGNNTLTSDIASGSSFDVGVTEVTYTATDIHGNQSTMSFNVTVTDGQNPTIANMPADISQGTDAGSCSAVVTWTAPSATDNCTLQTLGSDINSGATFQEGTTIVTYTAIDIYGNTTTATFNVTITSTDSDGDGICDNGDNCSDQMACNYADAANTTCILPTGCETCSNATGTGSIVDNDADDDGVCDANEIVGCQDNTACNYNSAATDAGACTFPTGCETCSGATDGTGTVVDNDSDGDGVCDANEIVGCQDNTACNYNSAATDAGACTYANGACDTCVGGIVVDNDADNDGVCDADEVAGCQDITACNYNAAATDAGPCTFANGACETCENGIVVDNDSDGDGVCDGDEIVGCQDNTACNYNSNATDSGSCTYASGCDACSGATDGTGTVIDNDADDDGVCDANEIDGCTDSSACNYDSDPTTDTDNTLCVYATGCETCSGETDGTGSVVDNDLDNDGVCDADEVTGCTDPMACNYDSDPTTDTDNTGCLYPTGCETCSGATDGTGTIVDNDLDNDGVCDADEVDGCTDPAGCNYNADPNLDSDVSLCVYATGCDTCSGETDGTGTVVDNDADDDGVCDANEVVGCEDAMACNYNSAATDSSPCTYPTVACETCSGETDGTGTVVDNDQDNDGVCDADEVTGCTDPMACNYDSDPTTDTDNTLCTYVDGICETCENGLIVDNDQDNDGVCDANEVTGCTDPTACNYDSTPTTDSDNSLCTYVDGICETCEGGTIVDNDADNDDVCDADEVAGCQDNTACNYNSAATDSDGSCVYATDVCETCSGAIDGSGTVLDNDVDNDGVCDADEVTGCTDATACNYDSDPTTDTDNTLCTYVDGVCDTCDNGVVIDNDQDNDGVCDADEITGCTDATACNYDSTPTTDTDNTLCTYVDGVCETCVNGSIVDNDADDDGVCDANEITGCTDPMACNYDSTPTTDTDNTLCTYVDGVCETCESGLIVDNDQDNDGVCDANEITGCTDPMACNFHSDPTTDTDNTLCTYTSDPCDTCSGETDGSGTVVSNDDDGDGTCNDADGCPNDPAKTAPGICGCGNVDTDVDNDGVCDDNDLCTDPLANNYQSPLGEECAPCPDAPIFNSILPVTPATTLSSTDGSISLDVTGGTATTLILLGINGAPDYSISLPASLDNLQAGYYQAHVLDDQGCIGVAQTSPGGSTLQQPGVYRELIIPFSLCCSGCGINDSDADGICDDDDNCTDQTAPNFADPANTECIQP